MVVSELRGEKIDIIPYNDEPARFVAKALSPARVREVLVDDEDKQATVIVPDDQLSLAIGRDGQNARLAARLTGWRVDIKSETEFAQDEDEMEYEGEEDATAAAWRCSPTGAAAPTPRSAGSRYCGLPQHQALSRFDTSQVAVLAALTDEEVAMLADPEAPRRRRPPGAREGRGRARGRRACGGRGRGAAEDAPEAAADEAAEEPPRLRPRPRRTPMEAEEAPSRAEEAGEPEAEPEEPQEPEAG